MKRINFSRRKMLCLHRRILTHLVQTLTKKKLILPSCLIQVTIQCSMT